MPAHPITPEQWSALLAAFRTRPGNVNAAAKAADLDWRTANRAWQHGLSWSRNPEHHKPIQQLIEEEQEFARARLAEDSAKAAAARAEAEQRNTDEAAKAEAQRKLQVREAAQTDATQSRTQEAQMIRLARGSATGLLVTLTQLAQGAARIGDRVRRGLEVLGSEVDEQGKPRPVTPQDAATLVRMVGLLTRALDQANTAAQRAMEMERLLLGEPTQIIGHAHLQDISVEEAGRRIQAANKAWERFEREQAEEAAATAAAAAQPTEPIVH